MADSLVEMAQAAAPHVGADDLLREVSRRKSEIDAVVSKSATIASEARAELRTNQAVVNAEMKARPLARVAVVALVIIFGAATYLGIGLIFYRPTVLRVLGSFSAPWGNGWWLGVFWTLLAAGVGMATASATEFLFFRKRHKHGLEVQHDIDRLMRERDETQRAWEGALDKAVREIVIQTLNERAASRFRSRIYVSGKGSPQDQTFGVGLSEVLDEANQISTKARQDILALLGEMPGGSIGISGPRGVGKSTLLSSICDGAPQLRERDALAINTSAPVEYDGRDFLLHLFSTLCRRTLRREFGASTGRVNSLVLQGMTDWPRSVLGASADAVATLFGSMGSLLLVVTVLASLLVAQLARPAPSGGDAEVLSSGNFGSIFAHALTTADLLRAIQIAPIGALAVLCILCLAIAFTIAFDRAFFVSQTVSRSIARRITRGHLPGRKPIVVRTREELTNIRFQRSYTAGWSGGLKAPVGPELSATTGLSYALLPESLPELVERFRSYVGALVREYGAVVVGIDELDKLKSAKDAEQFLNGVKSVFNIPGCYFLISVSEHALATFERRGLGFRDAFDSALDTVVQIDYLDIDDTWALMSRRVVNLPEPFLQLCHMLSGGLPRDLIRSARDMLAIAAARGSAGISIAEISSALVAKEAAAKIRATMIALRQADADHDADDLLVSVARLTEAGSSGQLAGRVSKLQKELAKRVPLGGRAGRDVLIAQDLCLYLQLLSKVHRIATLMAREKGWNRVKADALSQNAAVVRQALEVSVPLAAARLDQLEVRLSAIERALRPVRRVIPPANPAMNKPDY